MEVFTLPAIGLRRGGEIAFVRGFIQSYRATAKLFKLHRPLAALAMGGFTSAPPILAAKRAGARTFLHESNTIPAVPTGGCRGSCIMHLSDSPRLRAACTIGT